MDMRAFIDDLCTRLRTTVPLVLGASEAGARAVVPPDGGRVLMLAPHMDDPDAVAVTLKRFAEAGCSVHYLIVCSSHGGVTDQFAREHASRSGHTLEQGLAHYKSLIRRGEQIESARRAGFVAGDPEFLVGMEEDERGNLIATEGNERAIAEALERYDPDLALMPHGEDSNPGHIIVHRFFRRAAEALAARRGRPLLGLYNRDAKTTRIDEQLATPFDILASQWKTGLLEAHASQHTRNLEQRGYGFDERVLRMNRSAWDSVADTIGEPWTRAYMFAETFQVECFW